MYRVAIAVACCAPLVSASAELISISGGGEVLDEPPVNFPIQNNEQASVVRGIDEKQDLVLGADLTIPDLEDLIGVVDLPAGTAVDSHLIKFDPSTLRSVSGIEITFANDVLAVITTDGLLTDTHALFGREGLNYPGLVTNYGFEAGQENFSVNGNVITFSGTASNPGDHFRVLTFAVPTPGAGAVLAIGGLVVARRRR